MPARTKRSPQLSWVYAGAAFLILLALDQWTKHVIASRYALGISREVLPGLWFTYVRNTGAVWSLFQDLNGVFIALSIIALAALLRYRAEFRSRIERICLVLLAAGITGNLIDRIARGYVVDFIDLRWWPVFNIADSAIVVGIIVYLIAELRASFARRR